MFDFLDRARDIYGVGGIPAEWAAHFVRVFSAISALQSVHSKSSLDIRNLESVFTTFEMAKNIGRLADLPTDDVEKCVESLQAVIFYTLDRTAQFPIAIVGGRPVIEPPRAYKAFTEYIVGSRDDIVVITFNYDVALDFALAHIGLDVSYGLPGGASPVRRSTKLLKLHGSISWGVTESDRKIVACPPERFVDNSPPGGSTVCLNLTLRLKGLIKRHVGEDIEDFPAIVPPGLYKTEYQSSFTEVWKAAAGALRNADEIFVAGYSVPSTDFFFQNLYALGTVGPKILRKFWVFDPSPEVETRFTKFLGSGVDGIRKFRQWTFEQAVNSNFEA